MNRDIHGIFFQAEYSEYEEEGRLKYKMIFHEKLPVCRGR
jgi:hypothetical protein